jgi:hypothetical protein
VSDTVDAVESGDGFIYFRMKGERFDAPGMPADSVVEVQRFSELVDKIARGVWKERNDRQRAPSELVKAFDLRLVSVADGSAMPVLRLATTAPTGHDEEDFAPVFRRARDIVVSTVESLAEDFTIPDFFPREALPQLRLLGKSLGEGESIELAPPRSPSERHAPPSKVATLTPDVYETIQRIDAALDSEPAIHTIEGVVTEFDGAGQSFHLRDLHNQVRVCTLAYHEPELAERVKAVLAADGVTAPDVLVSGMGVVNRRGRLGDLWDVTSVQIVRTAEEKMLMARLSSLSALSSGWLGPRSEAPDREALAAVELLLPELARVDVVIAVTANSDGAVVLEWSRDAVEYTAQIEPGAEMFLCADDTRTDRLTEHQGGYDAQRLVRFVESGEIDG